MLIEAKAEMKQDAMLSLIEIKRPVFVFCNDKNPNFFPNNTKEMCVLIQIQK